MKVILAGSGKTLFFLCRSFASKGFDVVVINNDREECGRLSRQLRARIVYGDCSDPCILKDAGAMEADAVLAITESDQANLVTCQLASRMFGVKRIVALANDPDNEAVFVRLGVPSFSTANIIGSLVVQIASTELVTNLLPVCSGRVLMTEVVLSAGSPILGKTLKDLSLPDDSLVAVIIRNGEPIVPSGLSRMLEGDTVVLMTLPENHGQVLRTFTGEKDSSRR